MSVFLYSFLDEKKQQSCSAERQIDEARELVSIKVVEMCQHLLSIEK